MPIVLTWMSFAAAATLPTECPIVVTGEEVAGLRAEVVAPAVISVTRPLYDLRATYASAACPRSDGAGCAAGVVDFAGTLSTTADHDSYKCVSYLFDRTDTYTARATALTAARIDGADLAWEGASTIRENNACGEADIVEDTWSGALSVAGAWGDLEDDTVDGTAETSDALSVGGYIQQTASWNGTSGACAWTAASTTNVWWDPADYVLTGEIVVGGVTVTYAWSADVACAGCAWAPVESSTWVDGVRTGDADWAAPDLTEGVAPWIDADDDGWAAPTDCDDADPALNPDAEDRGGDAVDDDCDGEAHDVDGDGYGTDSYGDYDCDDADPAIHPRQADVCGDGVDLNCDGLDGTDCDGDGWGVDRGDCDDTDPAVNPGEEEVPCDGVNSDCGAHSEDCDGDGHIADWNDCDDTDAGVHSGADDPPDDGVDADCDGVDGVDDDRDGHDVTVDCDDADPLTFPGAVEDCWDHHDQDCDGLDGIGCAEAHEDEPEAAPAPEPTACGCGTGGGAAALLPLILALRRRRRGDKPTAGAPPAH